MTQPYEHLTTLAKGGLGSVDLVAKREGGFRRVYAMKRLLPQHRSDESIRLMFIEEARIAGLLRHANVASVLDVGEDAEGPYLIMDYVEGLSLREVAGRCHWPDTLPLEVSLEIMCQTARGLDAAHSMRNATGELTPVVHRDVSPSNILVGFDGIVRLVDFGIAKATGSSVETTTGILKGKVAYMSPEQLRFKPVGTSADVFALGVVLYELLAGARLYRRESVSESACAILEEPPPDISQTRVDLSDSLVELTFDLLTKDAGLRPSSKAVAERIEEVAEDLGLALGPSVITRFLETRFASQLEDRRRTTAKAFADLEHTPSPARTPAKAPGRPQPLRSILLAAVAVAAVSTGVALSTDDVRHPVLKTMRDSAPIEEPAAPAAVAVEPAAVVAEPAAAPGSPPAEPPTMTPTRMRRRVRMRPEGRDGTMSQSMAATMAATMQTDEDWW